MHSLRNIQISTVESIFKPGTVSQQSYSFQDAVKLFTEFTETVDKTSVPAYSGAVYGNTLYKLDINVVGMFAIVVDFDNDTRGSDGTKRCSEQPTLLKHLAGNLDGMAYFYHSTHSNKADWPKWRLIIPLDRQVSREEWPIVVNGVLTQIGGYNSNIDKSCFEPSRHFLFPSYSAENESVAFSGYSDGQEVVHVR